MNRRAHRIGRGLTCLGLLSTAGYLGWRLATLPSQPPKWLVGLAVIVEIGGFVGSGLLAWALWRTPRRTAAESPNELVDVVVRVDQHPIRNLRATLLALQKIATGRIVIVDLGARDDVAAAAEEFAVTYVARAPDDADAPIDRNGLKLAAPTVTTQHFFVLDAGDIPANDAISTLLPLMHDSSVAVAIGRSIMADDDSAEHGPDGLHELAFERIALNPALGWRGASILTESGALIRRVAVDSVEVGDEESTEAWAYWSLALMSNGFKLIAARGKPLLVRPVVNSQEAVYEQRVLSARASRTMILGPEGILRSNTLRLGQRLAVAASAVRPLSGVRRGGFIAVVVGSLLTGALPLTPNAFVFAALWAPGWVLTALGLMMMSRTTLRPGDRTRRSLRDLGASFQGLRHPLADTQRRASIMTPHALQQSGALVASVVVLSAVMMLRGLSEQLTHALGKMPYSWLGGLMVVALWSLAMALDVLRMFGKRNQLRRAARILASMPAEVDGFPATIADITALGAGFETGVELARKQRLQLSTTVVTSSGCTNIVLAIVVRNVRAVSEERWQVGVEFVDLTPSAVDPLIELCVIEPAMKRLGQATTADDTIAIEAVSHPVMAGRRVALRLTALAAVGGSLAAGGVGEATVVTVLVASASIAIGVGVVAGSIRPRRAPWESHQSTSSPSPDLAIR
jgi:PilZ domain